MINNNTINAMKGYILLIYVMYTKIRNIDTVYLLLCIYTPKDVFRLHYNICLQNVGIKQFRLFRI